MGKLKDEFGELVKNLPSLKNPEEFLALVETFDRRDKLFKTLLNDSIASKNASKAEPQNQYLRRTVVRTSFAMIEGLLNILNQTVVDVCKSNFFTLNNEELEKLTEETQTKNGGRRPKFMSLGNKLLFSFEIFARKMGGIEYLVDTTTDGWKEFEIAILIRNRLMHPRFPEDMILDENQMMTVLNATGWFLDIYKEMERQASEASSKKSLESLIKARVSSKR
jgi:hypothetical protein